MARSRPRAEMEAYERLLLELYDGHRPTVDGIVERSIALSVAQTDEEQNLLDMLREVNLLFLEFSFLDRISPDLFIVDEDDDGALEARLSFLREDATIDLWLDAKETIRGRLPEDAEFVHIKRLRSAVDAMLNREIKLLMSAGFFERPLFGFPGEELNKDIIDTIDEIAPNVRTAGEIKEVIRQIRSIRDEVGDINFLETSRGSASREVVMRGGLSKLVEAEIGATGLFALAAHRGEPESMRQLRDVRIDVGGYLQREPEITVTTLREPLTLDDVEPEFRHRFFSPRSLGGRMAAATDLSKNRTSLEVDDSLERQIQQEMVISEALSRTPPVSGKRIQRAIDDTESWMREFGDEVAGNDGNSVDEVYVGLEGEIDKVQQESTPHGAFYRDKKRSEVPNYGYPWEAQYES